MTDLEAAWAAVHDATPPGWYVGRPGFEERYNQWSMRAFDPSETPIVGKRSREWTAVGRTELELHGCSGVVRFVTACAVGHPALDFPRA